MGRKVLSELDFGVLSARLIRDGKNEFVEFFTRVPASMPKPVKRPRLKRRKRARSKKKTRGRK